MTPDAMIEARGLVFEYPGRLALDGVNLRVRAGSITSLAGPNGAGKTTLLKCLAALARPFSGSVTINGADALQDPRRCHESVGFLPDFFGLYDYLTVGDYLTYFAHARNPRVKNPRNAVELTARRVGLSDRLSDRVGTLSRGMRQRLGIAQAIVHVPGVLLLDEPASGLDPEARHSLALLLKELNAGGMTILVSSHILAELEDYSTDMVILKDGRVVEERSLAAVECKRVRLAVTVASGDTEPALRALAGAEDVEEAAAAGGGRVEFYFTGDEGRRCGLLKSLVAAGVEVCEFSVVRPSLQDEYLKRMKGAA
jgi:ABC-2 type transport system ATP-binding protein